MNGSSNYGAGALASASNGSLAFFLTFAAIFIILLKIRPYIKHFVLIFFIGCFTLGTCFLPLLSAHYTIDYAELEFDTAFGTDWRQKVEPASSFFLNQHYSLTDYFLGVPPKDCIIEKDVLYYNGEGIRLYFDAYIPRLTNLPGNNSVIISIHGGGWSSADKGFTNKIQVNKYFAAQGYVVFDIQYGLKNSLTFELITPHYVKGDFTLDDMIRHVGIFTNYLTNHSSIYGANLNSVFITGGSSGGNLACAVALAYVNTSFSHFFNPSLSIKGFIPYYPANGIAKSILGIDGSPELIKPEYLVNVYSPPCLIFHGTSDGIINLVSSSSLQNQYKKQNNTKCALIQLLFGGHVSDYYFTGIYNQMCLYYMERFLYLFH
jgi:acetyl esterase/lipase